MKVACTSCNATLNIDDSKIPAGGARIKCPSCQNVFPVKRAPAGATAPVPLPGISAAAPARTEWDDEPTRAVPQGAIPGATQTSAPPSNIGNRAVARTVGGAVPLPGISAAAPQSQNWEDESTRVAPTTQPQKPSQDFDFGGATSTEAAYQPSPSRVPASVPLPGGAAARSSPSSVVSLPGGAGGRTSPSTVPLPGGAAARSSPSSVVSLPGGSGVRTSPSTVPLPGGARTVQAPRAAAPEATFLGEAPVSPTQPVPLPGSGEAAAGDFAFDDATAGGAAGGEFSFDTEAPPEPAAGGFDFSEAPAPAAGGGNFDFAEPPPPEPAPVRAAPAADPLAFDFNQPADAQQTASSPSMGFGEVDFGGGGGAPGGDGLEFDPSSKPKQADDLEADLSGPSPNAPAPSQSGPVDGLEMLSFIDKTAKEAGAKEEAAPVRRFHIRRRSGKVFGPFEDLVIIKMLEEGQLLGNEEVSPDNENWIAIGTEPSFLATIEKLMAQPGSSQTMAQMPAVESRQQGPSMERLKQLYEGRMASVAVVQSKDPFSFKKHLPVLIGAAAALVVVIIGVTMGVATPYGYFGLKKLFPARVKADSREFAYLDSARKGFLADNHKALVGAKASAAQALQAKEYPEARAIWSQATYYLARAYGEDLADLATADGEQLNITLLGEHHVEVIKARTGSALQKKDYDGALALINDGLAREANKDDLELLFLRAEAFLAKRQLPQAKADYEQALKKNPKSARAAHGLGLVARAQNDLPPAMAKYSEALALDPNHVSSAVELADIAIIEKHDGEAGGAALAKALGDDKKAYLAARELGKALALEAELKVLQGKVTESVPLFEEALKVDPKSEFARARLGNAYMELHQPDKALPFVEAAATAAPDNLAYVDGYISCLVNLGKMDDAVKVLQTANARFPGNAKLAYLTGRVSDALDKIKDAEDAYKRAIAADPNSADPYLYLSRLFMRFRRYADARPLLESGLEKEPNNSALRVGMGELAYHERALDRAEKEFKKAADLNPNNAEAFLGLSKVALDAGKFEVANTMADKALQLNPTVPSGRLQKGTALWKLGKLEEAVTVLEAARDDEPRNLQIVVSLGAVEFEKGSLDNSLKYLGSALQREPGHPDANFYLARVKNARAEHTQAIEAMKRALDYSPKNPVYHYWMGRFFADARKTAEAIEEWKLALEIDPKYADALEAMGSAYFDRNDFKRAVEFYHRTLDTDPSRSGVRAKIGDTQMRMDDYDGAISSFQKALEADPDIKPAYFHLGQAYQEKKNYKKAIEWYRKTTEISPDNADAWLALGWLYKETKKKKELVAAFTRYLELKPDAENKKDIQDEIHFAGGDL